MTKQLVEILSGLATKIEHAPININEVLVKNIQLNSKEVKPSDLFLAYPGTSNDGRKYIDQAITNGASVVLYEPHAYELPFEIKKNASKVIFVAVQNLIKQVSLIAGNFYDHPSDTQNIYAVTGTNGKTSCAFLMSQFLNLFGKPSGFIGTIGYGNVCDKLNRSDTTTPSPLEMQRILADFKQQGIRDVAMEASSHALDQYRIEDINITTAIFSNLSQDHLDYHQTFEDYYLAKQRLFFFKSLKNIVINADDAYGVRLNAELTNGYEVSLNPELVDGCNPNILLYSLNTELINSCSAALIVMDQQNNQLLFSGCEKFGVPISSFSFEMPNNLVGQFNCYNLLAVIGALITNNYPVQQVMSHINQIKPPPGRMEIFYKKDVKLIVDYAHSPDALKKSLAAIRQHFGKNLHKVWCVFGCGGDRDKSKRPLMGEVAASGADLVVLTDDNPRTEDPNAIIKDIEKGFTELQKNKIFAIINDRRKAIITALENSHPHDVILIAGKGHEDYQIYGSQKNNYDERAFVEELIQ